MSKALDLFALNKTKIMTAAEDEVLLRIAAHHAPIDIIAAEQTRDGLRSLCDAIDEVDILIAAHHAPANILAAEQKRDQLLKLHADSIENLALQANSTHRSRMRCS